METYLKSSIFVIAKDIKRCQKLLQFCVIEQNLKKDVTIKIKEMLTSRLKHDKI